MKRPFPFEKVSAWFLLAFSATAVFSIFWQHLIWISILFWLIAWYKGRVKPGWPKGFLAVTTLLFLSTFFIGAFSGVNPANSFGTLHRDLTFFVFFLVGAMSIDFPRIQKMLFLFTHGAAFCALWGIATHFTSQEPGLTCQGILSLLLAGIFLAVLLIRLISFPRNKKKDRPQGGSWSLSLSLLLRQPIWAYPALGACFCLLFGIAEFKDFHDDRIESFGGYIMIFGGSLMTALVIQSYFLIREPKSFRHWTIALILGYALLLNQTRGAWVGLVVGLLLMMFLIKRKLVFPAILLLVAGYFLLPQTYQTRVTSIWDSSLVYSNAERVRMWESGWAISKDYPLFGIGQGNLIDVYPKYKKPEAQESEIIHLHNNFVQILTQNGRVGFLAYLLWLGAYFFESLRKRKWREDVRNWNLVLTCVFIAGLVWGLTEYTFSHQFMNLQFFFMGLQANLWKIAKQKK